MKATLHFDLNDPDDRRAHLRALKAFDMACVLFELNTNLKKKLLNTIGETREGAYEAIEEVFKEISVLMTEHNVDIDELI